MSVIYAVLSGAIFGLGIAISGMGNPAKVVNFFDVTGTWDPSLAFVLGAGVVVTFIGYRWVWRRAAPLVEARFDVPTNASIDRRLIIGSAIFGVGWGIAGFCPGASFPMLITGAGTVWQFVVAMLLGMAAARYYVTLRT